MKLTARDSMICLPGSDVEAIRELAPTLEGAEWEEGRPLRGPGWVLDLARKPAKSASIVSGFPPHWSFCGWFSRA